MKHAIGVIDSGSGGLTVWREIRRKLPNESILYIGDHANAPYSTKNGVFIRKRIGLMLATLVRMDAKIAVIACNTGTVAGIDMYRKRFPTIPIIGVVPVVKTASIRTRTQSIAILSTYYTAKSAYQKDLIKRYASGLKVKNIGSKDLVTYIEKGMSDSPIIRDELMQLLSGLKERKVDILALGCTHYPFLRRTIREAIGKGVRILDSGAAVARHTKRILKINHTLAAEGSVAEMKFLTSGDPRAVSRITSSLMGMDIRFQQL